jgi:hypothetical protein
MTTKKSETGKVAGNQTPNTPNQSETAMRRNGWKGVDTGKVRGNQTANTPKVNESK